VLDQLLASPQYGERSGRHWLNLVRYPEDDVRSLGPKDRAICPPAGPTLLGHPGFNSDMPYELFVKMQFAATC
jgi:hypothetical protein